jgi:hypothetical protein
MPTTEKRSPLVEIIHSPTVRPSASLAIRIGRHVNFDPGFEGMPLAKPIVVIS